MNIVQKFGEKATELVLKKPEKARNFLAAGFKGYGLAAKINKKSKELPARNYMMWASNQAMAKSLTHSKNTAIVSIFTPCEILHAMDILPVFPEGLGCYMTASDCEKVFIDDAEKNGVPETLCSYHKMLIGMSETGVLQKPLFIINTTMACDANQLSFRRLAEIYNVPHFVLDIPAGYNRDNLEYLIIQLKHMAGFIEEHTGRRLNPNKLETVMERAAKSIENYRKILALKAHRHESTKMTSHMIDVFALHVLLGTKETETYTQMLHDNIKKLPESKKGVRILWAHTIPYWQKSMCEIFNYNDRVEIIACDMNLDSLIDIDKNKPFESMARWILQNSFNGSADNRIKRDLNYAKQLDVDGIIYFCHWGCKQTLGASVIAKETFEKEGIPTLVIDGDGCDSRNIQEGQMSTRIEAFLEQLEEKK